MNGERRLAALSGTAIEGEYRALNAALTRSGRGKPDGAPLAALADLGPALVSRLIEQWRARMAIEYRSSMVFGQLALQLVHTAAKGQGGGGAGFVFDFALQPCSG